MGERPQLSVVVCPEAGDPLEQVLASIQRASERAGAAVEAVVAAQPPPGAEAPRPANARVLELLPLGAAYARNRGFAAAGGEVVAFLDGDVAVGEDWVEALLAALQRTPPPAAVVAPPGVAFRASPFRGLGGFDHALGAPGGHGGPEALELLLRARDAGERVAGAASGAGRAAHGFHFGRVMRRRRAPAVGVRYVAGLASRPRELARALPRLAAGALTRDSGAAPAALLEHVPPEIAPLLDDDVPRPAGAAHRAKTHFLYRSAGRMLHAYANPSERLRRAVAEREAIREETRLGGIPRLHAAVEARDAIWVLEDVVAGEQPAAEAASAWFPSVADWAVALAGRPGAPLAESAAWQAESRAVLEAVPAALAKPLEQALRAVSALGAVHMHGDFQRHNLRLDGERVGLVDWEGAWRAGIPGLDLVFCSLLAEGDVPDERVVTELAAGRDHPVRPLRDRLARLGVASGELPALLLVQLAVWSLGEERRLSRLGAPPGEAIFRPLLLRLGPGLAERASSQR